MNIQEEILSNIPKGSDQAISSQALWDRLGINARAGRKIIFMLRQSEKPILSNTNGYFLASDGDRGLAECKAYFRRMFRRAMSSISCARAIERFIRKNDHQISLFDLVDDDEFDELPDEEVI